MNEVAFASLVPSAFQTALRFFCKGSLLLASVTFKGCRVAHACVAVAIHTEKPHPHTTKTHWCCCVPKPLHAGYVPKADDARRTQKQVPYVTAQGRLQWVKSSHPASGFQALRPRLSSRRTTPSGVFSQLPAAYRTGTQPSLRQFDRSPAEAIAVPQRQMCRNFCANG